MGKKNLQLEHWYGRNLAVCDTCDSQPTPRPVRREGQNMVLRNRVILRDQRQTYRGTDFCERCHERIHR